jgi:chromosome segregation ATPase
MVSLVGPAVLLARRRLVALTVVSALLAWPPMGNWLVERRLTQVSDRLKSLRAELSVIDEQLIHLGDDAEDQEIRALVSETPGASHEARDARRHVEALAKHRSKVVEDIASLERRQDELLDRM